MVKSKIYTSSRSPEFVLLGLLYEKPGHGYELHQRLEAELGQVWHARQSQSYNILKRLETQGYIESKTQGQEKLPPRQMLTITKRGRERFEAWLSAPTQSSVRAIRVEFVTRLYFAQKLDPERIDRLFEVQILEIQNGLRRLTETYENLPPNQTFNRLGLDLRIRQLESILDWLDEAWTTLSPEA
jgi:DNA-binding PadR family transcriptional regulator